MKVKIKSKLPKKLRTKHVRKWEKSITEIVNRFYEKNKAVFDDVIRDEILGINSEVLYYEDENGELAVRKISSGL